MAKVSLERTSRCLRPANYAPQSYRGFSSANVCWSGHNRWSKIKHDKGKEDAKKNKERSTMAHELKLASSLFGPDVNSNPRLATLVSTAKKLGFPKASIENAIARGQGKSMTGQALESLTVEAMLPESTAVIIECQTDSKARTLSDIRLLIKDFGGNVATTNHLFERKGRIVFGSPCGQGDEALFEQLIEAHTVGADFADGDKLVVLTEPAKTKDIAEIISQASTREIESRDIFWDPKPETKVDATSEVFADFVGRLREDPSVQNIYTNANMGDKRGPENPFSSADVPL